MLLSEKQNFLGILVGALDGCMEEEGGDEEDGGLDGCMEDEGGDEDEGAPDGCMKADGAFEGCVEAEGGDVDDGAAVGTDVGNDEGSSVVGALDGWMVAEGDQDGRPDGTVSVGKSEGDDEGTIEGGTAHSHGSWTMGSRATQNSSVR